MAIEVNIPEPLEGRKPYKLQIKVVKAKDTMTVEVGALLDEVYEEALALGLTTLLNRGQSKITGSTYPDDDERAEAAIEKAQETLADIYEGKIRRTSGTKSGKGVRGEIMVEARRMAKLIVKDELKAAGKRVSHIKAADITALANQLLDDDPTIIEAAKESVAKRKEKKPARAKIDLSKVKEDAELVKKSAAKAEAAKRAKAAKAEARA